MTDAHTPVDMATCNARHANSRWVVGLLFVAIAVVVSAVGYTALAASEAKTQVHVQAAGQEEFKRSVLEALDDIKDELRALRRYHGE